MLNAPMPILLSPELCSISFCVHTLSLLYIPILILLQKPISHILTIVYYMLPISGKCPFTTPFSFSKYCANYLPLPRNKLTPITDIVIPSKLLSFIHIFIIMHIYCPINIKKFRNQFL